MRLEFTSRFLRDYGRLSRDVQARVDRALDRLLSNPRHPSLQVKKMQGYLGLWEGRVSRGYRFTFNIVGDSYRLRCVGPHDILEFP